MITKPEDYFSLGCGRCPHFATPLCKVKKWSSQLKILRAIVVNTDLKEEAKWGMPCYTYGGKNILLLSAFKEYCSLSFFKGALLKDAHSVLAPTRNSNASRAIHFRKSQEISDLKPIIEEYIHEAVEIEKSGRKVEPKPLSDYIIPEEFQLRMLNDPALESAFGALTPGRQKGYILHFAQAKQSKTRISRIEKCLPKIFDGIGLNDRYTSRRR